MESYARILSYGCYSAVGGAEAGAGSGCYLDVGDGVSEPEEEVRGVKAGVEAELVLVFVMIPYSKLRMCRRRRESKVWSAAPSLENINGKWVAGRGLLV